MNDEVDFLHACKHKDLRQIDTVLLMGKAKHFQSFQNSKRARSLQYLKKEVCNETDFLRTDKHHSGL